VQRGGDVPSSADQKLVDDTVHYHAQEEGEQQRSEEETFTLLPIRGWSTLCIIITTRAGWRRTNNSSATTRKRRSL
jgi:hypothetical protein